MNSRSGSTAIWVLRKLLWTWVLAQALPGYAQQLSARQVAEQIHAELQVLTQQVPQVTNLEAFNPGWIERLELRTETNRLDAERQRYSVRFRPMLPHIRKAERRLQQTQRDQLGLIGRDLEVELQALALLDLFEQRHMLRRIDLLDSLYQLQNQVLKVRQLRVQDPGYDPVELLEAEEELADLALSLSNLQAAIQPSALRIPLDRLVEVNQLADRAGILEALPFDQQELALELSQIDAEVDLEVAENRWVIDFLQVDYREDLLGRERFTLGGSVRIPRVRKHIRAIDELEVERIERSHKSDIGRLEDRLKRERQMQILLREIAAFEALQDEMLSRQARRMQLYDVLARAPEQQPEARINLLRKNLNDQLDMIDEAAAIQERYISMVAEGVLLDPAAIEQLLID